MTPKTLLKLKIHKQYKNPQEIIFQKLEFDEIKDIIKKKDFIMFYLKNSKTGFSIEMKLKDSLIK
jgi:hypothetical protein